jgi:uncharacterized protein YcbX
MSIIGQVESLWRYPVKSMRGEELDEIFAGFAGAYGDRLFAFRSSASPAEFPYFTARNQHAMLLYRPRVRRPNEAASPGNPEWKIEVETPSGETLSIDDPALIQSLCRDVDDKHQITLIRSDRAMTDCHPVSILSLQTVRKLSEETGATLDKRRFRANIYLDLTSSAGFAEDALVDRSLRVGRQVVISIVQRDSRCAMITLDPDTAAQTPALLKTVAQAHGGMAGVYGKVLTEGTVRKGDPVELLE